MQTREQVIPRPQLAVQIAQVTIFAALTALGARVQLHLPFTPVPITGQVFCVLLAGGVLGARLGFISQLEYLAAGAAGLPVFAHGGGLAALLGWTSGYLVAFPLAALVVGGLSERLRGRGLGGALVACLCGVAVIHVLGATWYAVCAMAIGKTTGLGVVLAQSVCPFLAIDGAKAALAASLFPGLRRRLSAA
jgi:biotin transport system substrate-specific component